MNTQQNNFGSCAVFSTLNGCAKRVFMRNLLAGMMTLLLCHAALALDINQANEAELDSIKGMGPSLSAKVLAARAQGPFKDWLDLMRRISGIRHSKAQQFSNQGLTVNHQPFDAKP